MEVKKFFLQNSHVLRIVSANFQILTRKKIFIPEFLLVPGNREVCRYTHYILHTTRLHIKSAHGAQSHICWWAQMCRMNRESKKISHSFRFAEEWYFLKTWVPECEKKCRFNSYVILRLKFCWIKLCLSGKLRTVEIYL